MKIVTAETDVSVGKPVVSVVMIFLNGERFIREAVESVFAQTFQQWELLLVDDGSTDGSSEIAKRYAEECPGRVACHDHPHHRNLGMSASRNLGLMAARGRYVAFLDCDDVWLPQKLAEQVALMEQYPDAGMVYGRVCIWHGWTGRPEDQANDSMSELGLPPDRVVMPPVAISAYLSDDAITPCPSSVLLQRDLLIRLGGFNPAFRDLYEDIVCWIKVGLEAPILPSNSCWSKYRQHADSACAKGEGRVDPAGRSYPAHCRRLYLEWVADYFRGKAITDPGLWDALERQRRVQTHPRGDGASGNERMDVALGKAS